MASTRSGVPCVGSIVVDLAKVIDAYPDQERLTLIRDVSVSTGGPALNLAVDLRRLGALFPLELAGVVGDDEHGRLVRDACAALGIDTSALRTVPDVAPHSPTRWLCATAVPAPSSTTPGQAHCSQRKTST